MAIQLHRSKKNVMIAGVAGGLGEYFAIDPALIRIFFILTALASGMGILLYFILWAVLPEATEENSMTVSSKKEEKSNSDNQDPVLTAPKTREERRKTSIMGGVLLVTLGLIFLAENLFPGFGFNRFWPVILIAIGVGLMIKSRSK
ncbi:MAG: PspC domain-containing protein [bacterium]